MAAEILSFLVYILLVLVVLSGVHLVQVCHLYPRHSAQIVLHDISILKNDQVNFMSRIGLRRGIGGGCGGGCDS